MMNFLLSIFTEKLFIPHGHCYLWKPELVWLHITSDLLIAVAYYSIPITLVYFVQKRQDLPYSKLFLLFGAFIVSCGTTHIMEVWTLWHPTYWLSGFLKAFTALISLCAAVSLVWIVPKALKLPSPAQLEAANRKLEVEIIERTRIEEALRESDRRFRAIFNNTYQYTGLLTPDGLVLEVNQTALDFVGLQLKDIVGRPFWEVRRWASSSQAQERLKAAIAQAAHNGEFVRYEIDVEGVGVSDQTDALALAKPDVSHGQREQQDYIATIDFSIKPVKDENGRVVMLVPEGRDITERKQAEAAVVQLNTQLEERVKKRTAQLEAANQLLFGQKQVLEMLATGASLPDILDCLLQIIEKQAPQMLCAVMLLDADGQTLSLSTAPSLPETYTQAIHQKIIASPNVASCGSAAYLKKTVIASDIANDLRWANFRDLALSHGLRACWSQPMFSTQGKVLGTVAVYYREPSCPSSSDLQLIKTAAHIAGIAIECKQAEQERTRLVAILEASSDYIGTADPQGNSLWNNARMKQLLGLNSEADVAKRHLSDYHPRWAFELIQEQGIPAAIRDGIWVGETALLQSDGEEIPASQMIIAHKSSAGTVEYFSMIVRALSELKRAEAVLYESEERFRATFEQAAVGITHANPEGRFMRVNQKFCDIVGYTHEEMLRSSFQEITYTDDLYADIGYVQRLLAGEIGTYSLEKRYIRKDRSLVWVNITVSLVRDPSGEPKYFIAVVMDISSLKETQEALSQANEELEMRVLSRTAELSQANAALAESEERLRLFIENVPSAVAMFDRQMHYLAVSQRWLLDYDLGEDDIIGRSHYEVFKDLPDRWKAEHQQTLAGIVTRSGEDHFLRPDGTKEWFRYGLHPWRNSTGEVGGIIIFTEFITQRKEAEQKLKQAITELARSNQELEQFAYVASHDLREPLRKIKSYTDLLVKRYQGQLDEKADKYIAYITDGAVRMQTLITDLLTYSRVGIGDISPEPTHLDIILNRTLADLSTVIQESNATITADPLPIVRANATQMGQLLQNLIANAIKFRGEQPPHVNIRATLHNQSWTISVQDNGIGIEPQYADRIFIIFQRLHTKDEYPGTGIGLAVCKKIVERHGGQIWVESELGGGTTFFFTIPAF